MDPGGSTSKSSCFSFIALAPFLFFSFEFILSMSELVLSYVSMCMYVVIEGSGQVKTSRVYR